MKKLVMFGIFAALTGTLGAQEFPRFAFDAGAGFTTPAGSTGNDLDTGWNVRAGVGYNFVPRVGAMVNFGFDNMGINSTALNDIGYGGGRVRVFSVTLDPIVHLTPHSHVDLYITGGGGYFREDQQFLDAGVAVVPSFFGPQFINTNYVVSNYSVNKPGLDGGVGIAFGNKWGGRFFAEARYVRIFSGGGYQTDYLPVTFGFRR